MTESVTPESVGRAGGCEWFADGTRVQYARCEPCIDPCPVCGSDDACGYDSEGRPLIHALGPEVDL